MNCRLFCFAPFGGNYAVHHQLDMVLSAGVKLKGGETITLGCDSFLQNCEAVMHCDESIKQIECANCAIKGRSLLGFAGLPYYTLNQLVTPEEIEHINKWSKQQSPVNWESTELNSDQLGKWSLSSLQTAFQITKSDLHRKDIVPFYQSLLRNSALSAIAVKRIIETFSPTVALVFNGRFAQYRTAYEILRRAGIRVITHERGFSDNTFLFYDNATISQTKELFAISRPWQQIPLKLHQLERVREYVRGREVGKDFNTPAFINYSTDEVSVRSKLYVGNEPLVGFFSSTEAEMAQAEDANIANVQIPLLKGLVNALRSRPDVTMVVRHHPNLVGGLHHDTEYGFITDLYKIMADAPSNLRTIMPTEKISSYALMWNLDGAIVPFSSVGLEVSSRGSASMTSAYNPYCLAQTIAFDDLSKLDFLSSINTLVDESRNFSVETLKKAYRFIYSYIERVSVRFQSFGMKNFYEANITESFIDDITQNRDPNLIRVINGIINSDNIYPMPESSVDDNCQQQETEFLSKEVESIKARKQSLFEQSTKHTVPNPKVLHVVTPQRTSLYPAVFGQRYQNIITLGVPYDAQSLSNNCHHLLKALETSDAPFVSYTHASVSFDGNFVSAGVETLLDKQNSEASILLRGTWLSDQNGNIYSDFLSAKRGNTTKTALKDAFKKGLDPLVLLSWGFYRTETFKQILFSLLHVQTIEEAEDIIIRFWNTTTTITQNIQCSVTVY